MIETVLELLRFCCSLLFGVALSALFSGIELKLKNKHAVLFIYIIFLIVQSVCGLLLGIETTSKLYPLIIHLPTILILIFYFKRPPIISTVSVLSAYLCCQAPRWIGILGGAIFNRLLADHIFYITSVFLFYYLLKKYVAGSVRQLMEKSKGTCMLLGSVPLLYYVFDYITTIYTDMLYKGASWALQFMPSTISAFYFVFIIIYYTETQKQISIQKERDMLATQFRQAQTEFASLRQMQQSAAAYRHDMRHHVALLQGMASNGRMDEIKEYLRTAQADMDAITPVRYSENETVNLILSSFSAKARQLGIRLTVDVKLPDSLPFSDTELCSLISNGLENAVTAAAAVSDPQSRVISVRVAVHRGNLLLSMENPYTGQVIFQDGFPVSRRDGHGYGTRSIAAIVNAHSGQVIFDAEDGVFKMKAVLPLAE